MANIYFFVLADMVESKKVFIHTYINYKYVEFRGGNFPYEEKNPNYFK